MNYLVYYQTQMLKVNRRRTYVTLIMMQEYHDVLRIKLRPDPSDKFLKMDITTVNNSKHYRST